MRLLGTSLLVLTVGCGYSAPYRCDPEGLGPVYSEAPVDCRGVQYNADMAVWVLSAKLGVGQNQLRRLAEVPILIVDANRITWSDGEQKTGDFNFLQGIRLTPSMGSLVHELLHAKQTEDGIYWTGEHPGWDRAGYYAASAEYFSFSLTPAR